MSFDRRRKIKQLLDKYGIVSIKELEKLFPNVSSMTLRRDLEYFESIGQAIRVRGGARAVEKSPDNREAIYSLRETENYDAKVKIAKIAATLIEPDRSVFLDSGTTMMSLARLLPDLKLSILTSGPNIALEAVKRYNTNVNLIGGTINRHNLSVSGMMATEFVRNLNIDTAFMVASGFTTGSGFSCGNYSECELKSSIIKKARTVIMLMDSSKFDKNLPFTFSELGDINYFITDQRPDDAVMEAAEVAGVTVLFDKQ